LLNIKIIHTCNEKIRTTIEDIQDSSKNVQLNWTPEVRKDLKGMISAGTSLKIKMQKLGFDMRDLPPFAPGEEKDYLTKES